jgi:hypothetical protein
MRPSGDEVRVLDQNFADFLRLLNRHEVEYLIVGGYAVAYHGFVRATGDQAASEVFDGHADDDAFGNAAASGVNPLFHDHHCVGAQPGGLPAEGFLNGREGFVRVADGPDLTDPRKGTSRRIAQDLNACRV